ncbi:hypothetical protein V2J09_001575 [Rumex salicifolius]
MQNFTSLIVFSIIILYCNLAFSCFAVGSESKCIGSKIAKEIKVSKFKGKGQFNRIQDAIDSIPSNNRQWIRVSVHRGTYIEQVEIPNEKECVILQGHTPMDTVISFDAHKSTDSSATFSSFADNFVAKNITFRNSYNSGNLVPATAARIYGDKSAFYNCHFEGIQDTLWDVQGRHYFKSCRIQGSVDFIWGNGQSVYEDCDIKVLSGGFITAQGRQGPNDPSGFVFIRGKVHGLGLSYLGRAYGPHSRVVFYGTHFARMIQPLGWDAWRALHKEWLCCCNEMALFEGEVNVADFERSRWLADTEARNCGFCNIEVETDALAAVQYLRQNSDFLAPWGLLILDIRFLCSQFSKI